MNIKEQKRGISLIVLVITIIVMIILAAAIILSLDGSNIIERAKGAQSSNDVATAKEIVALAKSEWSFERQEGYDTFREYAESKLEEAGFDMDNTYVEDSGRVLFDTAARFAKAGVEIGTEVTGYTLNSTATYTTSGKENTYDSEEDTETNPQPVTINRDAAIKWTYIGTDKEGNALIAGSVTADSPKITLGGKGGYVNGPAELDKICDAMYSTAKGTARSMNIEDVTRVLEYTGETSAYYDTDYNYVPTKNAKSIGQIAKEIGYDMSGFASNVPETGKDIATYKSDWFGINKINDVNEYNVARTDLVYPATANTKLTSTYFISSSYVGAEFAGYDGAYANFGIYHVSSSGMYGGLKFDSYSTSGYDEYAIRPVVQLTSDVQVSYNGTVATLH